MIKTYQLKVNDDAVFESQDLLSAPIDIAATKSDYIHVLKDNKSHKAKITASDFSNKNYQVTVNGNTYQVNIQTQLDKLINELGFSLNTAKQINSIKAPMPGLILEVNIEPGQTVKQGDNLLILEAMKMENNLTSPREGVIKAIHVSKGETVDKGLVLIEFE
ncbi:acyl-CoA carboxylase biotin carboxyl carrier protein subunit [Myroides sp. LJL119]